MKLGKPQKTKKTITREVVVKPQRTVEEQTGEFSEVTVYEGRGIFAKKKTERRPVTRTVTLSEERETVEKEKSFWLVDVEADEETGTPEEVHEFANEVDANNFIKDTRRGQLRARNKGRKKK